MTYAKATQLAASVGQALAFVFGFIGLFTSPMLLFIGLFVWIGASQEACAAQIKSALSGTPASAAMLTEFETLQAADTLADAVRVILRGSQHDFPVLDGERVVGVLTRADLLLALTEFGQDHPVTVVMRREFLTAEPAEMLEKAFQHLQECDCHTMPVVHDGRIVGLVTMDNLGEYLLIAAALQERGDNFGLVKRLLRGVDRRNAQGSEVRSHRYQLSKRVCRLYGSCPLNGQEPFSFFRCIANEACTFKDSNRFTCLSEFLYGVQSRFIDFKNVSDGSPGAIEYAAPENGEIQKEKTNVVQIKQ